MNEAELQRYLSETPWFPTALLPAAGVTWESVDERSARVSLDDGDVTYWRGTITSGPIEQLGSLPL